jgi:hypothetical protein
MGAMLSKSPALCGVAIYREENAMTEDQVKLLILNAIIECENSAGRPDVETVAAAKRLRDAVFAALNDLLKIDQNSQ